MSTGMIELVGVGPSVYDSLPTLNAAFVPNSIRLMSQVQEDSIPLLKGKQVIDNQYFICKNNSCSAPMTNVELILANI
jgi:uncharacterized protein YyaL (SSP411 family)